MRIKTVLALIVCLLFLVPLVSANLITNPGFESYHSGDLDSCCDAYIGGCGYTSPSTYVIPDNWTTNHLARPDHFPNEGYFGEMIFSEKANNCSFMGSSTCGLLNETIPGYITQTIYNVSNTSLGLEYYVRECPDYYTECGGFWYETKDFGDPDLGIWDYYQVIVGYQNADSSWTNVTYVGYAETEFGYPDFIDLTEAEINHSLTNFNMSVTFLNPILAPGDNHLYCFIVDDVSLTYETFTPHFALDYIDDMTTHVPLGYTMLLYSGVNEVPSFVFNTSSSFDGVSMAWVRGECDTTTQSSAHDQDEIRDATIYYDDGSSVNVSEASNLTIVYTGTLSQFYSEVIMPIIDYENIKNITVRTHTRVGASSGCHLVMSWLPNTAYMSIRENYDNELLTPAVYEYNENIYGNESLYPVIMFNGSVDGADFLFTSYNFMFSTITTDFELYQYREDGVIKNVYGSSEAFGIGYDQHTITTPFIDYDEDDYIIGIFYFDPLVYTTYTSNTTTFFGSPEATGCTDYCDGTTLVDRTFIEAWGICTETRILNYESCEDEIVIEDSAFSFASEGIGNFFGVSAVNGLFILAVIISMAVSFGVGGYFKSPQLVGICLFICIFMFTVIEYIPSWVGISLLIVTGFLLVKWLKEYAPGGSN